MITLKKYFVCDDGRAKGAFETLTFSDPDQVLSHLPSFAYMHPQMLGEIFQLEELHPEHQKYEECITILYDLQGPYEELEVVVKRWKSRPR